MIGVASFLLTASCGGAIITPYAGADNGSETSAEVSVGNAPDPNANQDETGVAQTDGASTTDDTNATTSPTGGKAIRFVLDWKGIPDLDGSTTHYRQCGSWGVHGSWLDTIGHTPSSVDQSDTRVVCNTDADCPNGTFCSQVDFRDQTAKYCTVHSPTDFNDSCGTMNDPGPGFWCKKSEDDVGCQNENCGSPESLEKAHQEIIKIVEPIKGERYRLAVTYFSWNGSDDFIAPTDWTVATIFIGDVPCATMYLEFDHLHQVKRLADVTWDTGTCADIQLLINIPDFDYHKDDMSVDPANTIPESFWCDNIADPACVARECPSE